MKQVVFLVDDDPAVLASLRYMLEASSLSVESFASPQLLLARLTPQDSGCVVTDYRMPQMNGLQLMKALRDAGIKLGFIMLTGHGDIPSTVDAMKLGAVDVLEKPCSEARLLDRIQEAMKLDRIQRENSQSLQHLQQSYSQLKQRERDVMRFAIAGYANKQIAAEMKLSIKTIEVYRSRVMDKMHASSFAELVKMGQQLQS